MPSLSKVFLEFMIYAILIAMHLIHNCLDQNIPTGANWVSKGILKTQRDTKVFQPRLCGS